MSPIGCNDYLTKPIDWNLFVTILGHTPLMNGYFRDSGCFYSTAQIEPGRALGEIDDRRRGDRPRSEMCPV